MAYKKNTKKKHVDVAVAHVNSSFNNTLVSITTKNGDVLLRGSAGALNFKGSRKGTPFAASQVANNLAVPMKNLGITTLEINLSGPGAGRDSIIKSFQAAGFDIPVLRDVTPLAHNGPRAPKKRRV